MNAIRPALAGLFLLLAATSGRANPVDPAVMAPIHQFADAFNTGDQKTAAEAFIPNAAITDALVPFHWTSYEAWYRDYLVDAKRRNVTDVQITLGAPTGSIVRGISAYVVIPTAMSGTQNGNDGSEDGTYTFTLIKTPAGWRIQSATWTKQQ
jgi:Domain of unknown function (DUF4440)